MTNNSNKEEQMTFTAKIEALANNGTVVVWCREVEFSDRQSAIDYLWPFYKSRKVHLSYKCTIVRSDGVVLLAPNF